MKLIRDASTWISKGNLEESSVVQFRHILNASQIELFFDIGANVGTYSWIARSEGVKEILLFEPDVTNQRLLGATIQRNSIDNCFLMPFAVSSKVGIEKFLVDNASGTTGSLVDDTKNKSSLHSAYGMNRFRSVLTLKLDVFCEFASKKRTMLKIDVEGAEKLVFEGAQKFLSMNNPFVLIEAFERRNLEPLEVLGYHVVDLLENHNYLLKPPGFGS